MSETKSIVPADIPKGYKKMFLGKYGFLRLRLGLTPEKAEEGARAYVGLVRSSMKEAMK